MQNPFETGHVKNYLLLYASIVVIMILFFIASSLFHEVKVIEPKVFDKNITIVLEQETTLKVEDENVSSKFRLMEKAY